MEVLSNDLWTIFGQIFNNAIIGIIFNLLIVFTLGYSLDLFVRFIESYVQKSILKTISDITRKVFQIDYVGSWL